MKTIIGSVIYKQALSYFDDFFNSLIAQNNQDFSILLINDNISLDVLEDALSQYKAFFNGRLTIYHNDKAALPYELRIKLLEYALICNGDILVMLDCDDKAAFNRVDSILSQFDPYYTFFYNELLDFKGNKVMPILPDETKCKTDIGEYNYLGLSNNAINLHNIDREFIQTLYQGKTEIFDWYLFSRILINGGMGKKVNDCYTYYRIYESNTVGKYKFSDITINKEIKVKIHHYTLLEQYDNYYKMMKEKYQNKEYTINEGELLYWWEILK